LLPEIDRLIDLAIADGQITEKERNVILRKAAELGADIDEVEMVLDGRLHQLHSAMSRTVKDKQGDVKICPSCGASVRALQLTCDYCKHEFRNVNASSAMRVLSEQLAGAAERIRRSKTVDPQRISIWNEHLFAPATVAQEINRAQAAIISSFPVPNTREDLLEFMVIASAEAKKKPNRTMGAVYDASDVLIDAWRTKLEELVSRARLTGDSSLHQELLRFESQLLQYKPTWIDRVGQTLQKIATAGCSGVVVLFILVTLALMIFALRLIF
jgi:hypothetical protein